MTEATKNRLIWIDLEMTGLDTANDTIIEIATIITDGELNILAEGPVCAVRQESEVLLAMDSWNRRHHTDSGLWQRVIHSPHDMAAVETTTIDFLNSWVEKGVSPMCGNSVCQDRRFIHRLMPNLYQWFHYRNLDVEKENRHEALSDIRESIEELRYYRQYMGEFGGDTAF
jgi:oligoribonuclease